jgi:methylmalonyl-CoA mutase, C-terminal domain
MQRRIRVLVGKPGLDGHDRGARVVASALRDAGMEVIYTGLRATPEAIAQTALQEAVDVVGLSVLSGAHEPIAKRILELLAANGLDVPVVMGGVIPPDDRERLHALGVAAVFGQEALLSEIVAAVQKLAESREAA